MKVLIADDDRTTKRFLAKAVSLFGHEVVTADDGLEALTLFEVHHPDVVLTDWEMPGKSGVELIQDLRQRPGGGDVFVILTTAMHGDEQTFDVLETGVDDYLLKPVSAPRLKVVLQMAEKRIERRRKSSDPSKTGAFSVYEAVLTALPRVILAVDAEGFITYANRPELQSRLGVPAGQLYAPEVRNRLEDAFAAVSSSGKRSAFDHTPIREVADARGTQTIVSPLRQDGRPFGFVLDVGAVSSGDP